MMIEAFIVPPTGVSNDEADDGPLSETLVGFGGAKVLEVVIDDDGDTFRAIYTVKFAGAVYVLHVFQKKSVKGKETPKPDMRLIRARLRIAEADYRAQERAREIEGEKANEQGA